MNKKILSLLVFFISIILILQVYASTLDAGEVVIDIKEKKLTIFDRIKNIFVGRPFLIKAPAEVLPGEKFDVSLYIDVGCPAYGQQIRYGKLFIQKKTDGGLTNVASVDFTSQLSPNGCYTAIVNLKVTAPNQPGDYILKYQIFGDGFMFASESRSFKVVSSTPTKQCPSDYCSDYQFMFRTSDGHGKIYHKQCYYDFTGTDCVASRIVDKYKVVCDYSYVVEGTNDRVKIYSKLPSVSCVEETPTKEPTTKQTTIPKDEPQPQQDPTGETKLWVITELGCEQVTESQVTEEVLTFVDEQSCKDYLNKVNEVKNETKNITNTEQKKQIIYNETYCDEQGLIYDEELGICTKKPWINRYWWIFIPIFGIPFIILLILIILPRKPKIRKE